MSNRKHTGAFQDLMRQIQKIARGLTKRLMNWLLRTAFILNRRSRSPVAGFILPTTVLLLLVVSLTVGAIVFRAYNRSTQVIGESQQRVIYNAATPAIDRARAKLENLFDPNRDNRYPGGVPAENTLTGMLLDDGSYSVPKLTADDSRYKLPDEERLDLNGDGKKDNAWLFRTDTNGDGAADATVAYSVLIQNPTDVTPTGATNPVAGSGVVKYTDAEKAASLWTRHGPLSNQLRGNCAVSSSGASSAAQGWYEDLGSSSILRKNFQVDAIVIPDSGSSTVTTLEMHQDRQLDRGNKWGAWFRTDLEVFPGTTFNWNGAMHTEGSLVAAPASGGSFTAYLVSAQASCLMSSASNSEITVAKNPSSQTEKFRGLAISGNIRNDEYSESSNIHVWPGLAAGPTDSVALNKASDSAPDSTPKPADLALNPVSLLTEDISKSNYATDTTNANVETPQDWQGLPQGAARIYAQSEIKPYVDDLYRADDRWGPKPRYDLRNAVSGNVIGQLIPSSNSDLVNNTPPDPSIPANVGLDGYWERRAYNEGMRIIVGQRLALGNSFGWEGTNDPLYPPNSAPSTRAHETRQRRTLRDNLAAVQATAIYHKDSSAGRNFPVACLASTVHPGTAATLTNSIKFNTQSINGIATILTDFLTGYGTNGWEFSTLPTGVTDFAASIASGQPLGKALRNLANFAGDPAGAFPPVPGTNVRPYPLTSMWGNFSELRQTLKRFDGLGGNATAYNQLSLADQSNLHTAACTLGVLAYNISFEAGYDYANTSNQGDGSNPGLSKLGNVFFNLVDGKQNNGEVRNPATGNYFSFTSNSNVPPAYYTDAPAAYAALPPEAFIQALLTEPIQPTLSTEDRAGLAIIARIVFGKQQVERDRIFGFKTGSLAAPVLCSVSNVPGCSSGSWQANGNKFKVKVGNADALFPTGCDPETFPLNSGTTQAQEEQKVGLALALCKNTPKYPALFYLFPKVNHDHDGDNVNNMTLPGYTTLKNDQPTSEPYISDTNIPATGFNSGVTYNVVGATVDDFSKVALQPKDFSFGTTGATGWKLPTAASTSTGATNFIMAGTTPRAVGFLDRAIFNSREMMTTRVMDVDLGMLRRTGLTDNTTKPWLPISGIVYAFREDAVREDAIARPANGTATDVRDLSNPKDPDLRTTTSGAKLSVKQVDYIPDPDRRPHGFRLRDGAQLKRNDSFGISTADNVRGLSFFTDSPVYIQGDFNLHQTGADDTVGTRLEEFTTQLPDGVYSDAQFYGRTTRETNFAKPTTDRWRPTEILADAVTILSNTFCDGSIEDTFVTAGTNTGATVSAAKYNAPTTTGLYGPGCSDSVGKTSFLNQNRPSTNASWKRENSADSTSAPTSPVKIDRNGNPIKSDGTVYPAADFYAFSDDKARMAADSTTTRVNSIIVSGVIPSRPNQYNGGMHNFPRFIEDWTGKTLRFAGSFLQLSFSNYATGLFDQESWEPGSTAPTSSDYDYYYKPPTRAWGYDPALQLAPAGPAAARFVTAGRRRNEFYNEFPINDPYMNKLCNAARTSGVAGVPTNIKCPA